MDEQPKSRLAMRVTYLVLFVMLLYPLSAGPIIWLHNHDVIPDSTLESLEVVYYPVGRLVELKVPVVAPLLQSYVDFWDSI